MQSVFAVTEQEMGYRASASVRIEPVKKVKLYLMPELRFGSSELDKLLLGTELKYSPLKYLDIGGSYNLVMNFKTVKPTEYTHRFAFYMGTSFKIDRFEPSLRIMYANYGNEVISNFMRYKAKLDYDIPKAKIDPYLSAELYQQLTGELYKIRYSVGVDWRFVKNHSIGLNYKLDNYINADKMKHIVNLEYGFKF